MLASRPPRALPPMCLRGTWVFLAGVAQQIDHGAQRRRVVAAVRIIEMETGKGAHQSARTRSRRPAARCSATSSSMAKAIPTSASAACSIRRGSSRTSGPLTATESAFVPLLNCHLYSSPEDTLRQPMQRWPSNFRATRPALPSEVGRGRDDGQAQVPDPHGAHAVLEVFAEADAGVETGFDDIGETLVRHHFQGDAGIVAGQFAETWREDETDGVSRCVDSYQAVRRFAKAVKAVQRGGDVFERRVQVCQQVLAGLGRRDVASGAVEQADAELGFQFAQGVAERRRGYAEGGGGATETAFASDGDEGGETGEIGLLHWIIKITRSMKEIFPE